MTMHGYLAMTRTEFRLFRREPSVGEPPPQPDNSKKRRKPHALSKIVGT
jgi:hypothetical protein